VSADNIKWRVNRGVRASNLPPAARLIMFVLSDMADAKTGMVPLKQTPSLADLARETGHGESTVKEQLAVLEELGWVKRSRPNASERARHVPTYYQVAVGSPGKERPPLKRKPRVKSKPSDEAPEGQELAIGEGQEMALESEAKGQSEGQELANRGPGANDSRARSWPSYLKDDDLDDHYDPSLGPNADASAPSSVPKKRTGKQKAEAPPRADVNALCQRLAELMIANECKPPTISQHWRDEARRMLDIDGRDFDKAMHLLDWSQQNKFWRKNILSMPKFREKYDQLRLDALAEWEGARNGRGRNGYQPYDNPTDPNAYSGGIQ